MDQNSKCCIQTKSNAREGLFSGILYGLLPHSFCLAFALFSVVGAITMSAFLKNILLVPNIFYYLVIVSLLLATISVYVYLRKTDCLCKKGIKNNWKYISTIYSTTIIVNLIFFYGIIPVLANVSTNNTFVAANDLKELSLKVDIPCTGHSFLIIQEIKKCSGVSDVKFEAPDIFNVTYDNRNTSLKEITALEIFKTYPVTIILN